MSNTITIQHSGQSKMANLKVNLKGISRSVDKPTFEQVSLQMKETSTNKIIETIELLFENHTYPTITNL